MTRWRVGVETIGEGQHAIYLQAGPEPSRDDELIGVMSTPDLAAEAVVAHHAGEDWQAFVAQDHAVDAVVEAWRALAPGVRQQYRAGIGMALDTLAERWPQ